MQPKNVTFPTDAKPLFTAIIKVGELTEKNSVDLRQSYARVAKRAVMMVGRYAHAKQFKRMNRELKFLRTQLGRLIRDITRKIDGDPSSRRSSSAPSPSSVRSANQKQRQRGWKLYSWHAPEVKCIAIGKAVKPYEFGVKVSITTTNKRCTREASSSSPPARSPDVVVRTEAAYGKCDFREWDVILSVRGSMRRWRCTTCRGPWAYARVRFEPGSTGL